MDNVENLNTNGLQGLIRPEPHEADDQKKVEPQMNTESNANYWLDWCSNMCECFELWSCICHLCCLCFPSD